MIHIFLSYSWRELWNMSGDFAVWQALLLALFFTIGDIVLYTITWLHQREGIIEYGYPKAKTKALRKHIRTFSVWDKVLLIRLAREATRKGLFLYVCLFLNFLNCGAIMLTIVSLVGMVVTRVEGWSLMLSLFLPIGMCLFSELVHFVPDLFYMPSIRGMYRTKGKRK
ncbi:MAG: hypothetical protein SOV46_06740 [Candidatus Faecousia sp.]|nr:hypothetical protein [Candidatus Faecousia sp.]